MPFDRRLPGQAANLSADELNAMLEVAGAARANRLVLTPAGAGPAADDFFTPTSLVRVKNTTGSTLAPRSVLTPSGVVLDPEADPLDARRRPAFLASAPVADSDPVLIAFDGIANGTLGRAAVTGVTVASVVVTDTEHRYARPAPGDLTSLHSAATGQVQLLQTFGETGTYLCYVLLQGGTTASSGCEGTAWLTALRPADCLRLTFTYTPPAAIDLSVTDCAECPDGASEQYTFTLAGGTGDFAVLNGVWTVTRDTGCDWTGTLTGATGWTATLTFSVGGSAFVALVDANDGGGPVYAATGLTTCRGPFDSALDENTHSGTGTPPAAPTVTAVEVQPPEETQTLDLTWDSETELWTSEPEVLTICGETYTVTLDQGAEELTLTGELPDGGSMPFTLTRSPSCGGCEYARFDFSRLRLCPCAPVAESACDRLLSVRVERISCYDATPVEISCCPGATFPTTLFLTFNVDYALPGCGVIPAGTVTPLVYSGGVWLGTSYAPPTEECVDGNAATWEFRCTSGSEWELIQNPNTPVASYDAPLAEGDCESGSTLDVLLGSVPLAVVDILRVTGSYPTDVAPLPATIPGYTGPGWYLTSAGKLNLTDDSTELCRPLTIICGPYDSEALLDAAIADGSCFPDGCTPIPGWGGAGWYCVEAPGGSGPTCEPLELLAGDECDTTITICGGPYADEATATAACGEVEPPHAAYDCVDGACVEAEGGAYSTLALCEAVCNACCPSGQVPAAEFAATVTSGEFSGDATMSIIPGFDSYTGNTTLNGDTTTVSISCVNDVWTCTVRVFPTGGGASSTATFFLSGGPPLAGSGTLSGGGTVSVSAPICVPEA